MDIIKLFSGKYTFSYLMSRFFDRLENRRFKNNVNWFATLYVNFRLLPFNIAKQLPILLYGKIDLAKVQGTALINSTEIYRGMIKIGRHRDDYTHNRTTLIKICKSGRIIFNGVCSIACGCIIQIKEGDFILGDRVWFGQGVRVDCNRKIFIDDWTSITYDCKLFDSNHHYTYDENHVIKPKEGEIKIGKRNWIGNNSTITKGCITSDGSICAHGSWLCKDYISLVGGGKDEPMTLAGVPAKVKSFNMQRLFSSKYENLADEFFNSHLNANEYKMNIVDDESEIKFFI